MNEVADVLLAALNPNKAICAWGTVLIVKLPLIPADVGSSAGGTKMRALSSGGMMPNLTGLRGFCLAHSRPRRAPVISVRREQHQLGRHMGNATIGVMASGPERSLRWHLHRR